MQQYSADPGGGGSSDSTTVKRLRIKHFAYDGGRGEIDATALGEKKMRAVDLPAFTIDDIGGTEGATPDAVAEAVFTALTCEAVQTTGAPSMATAPPETSAEFWMKTQPLRGIRSAPSPPTAPPHPKASCRVSFPRKRQLAADRNASSAKAAPARLAQLLSNSQS